MEMIKFMSTSMVAWIMLLNFLRLINLSSLISVRWGSYREIFKSKKEKKVELETVWISLSTLNIFSNTCLLIFNPEWALSVMQLLTI